MSESLTLNVNEGSADIASATVEVAEPIGHTAAGMELLAEPEFVEDLRAANKHLFLLHGWSNTSKDMERWLTAIKSAGVAGSRTIWNVTYASNKAFPDATAELIRLIKEKPGYLWEDVQIVGFSMGGLIARTFVASGLPVTRLATCCSPHLGLMDHVLQPFDPGVMSLRKGSRELQWLNNHKTESARRRGYMFLAVQHTHKNDLGTWRQPHDTVVEDFSARGDGLGVQIQRENVNVLYTGGVVVPPGDPHGKGQDPKYCPAVIDFLRKP